MQNIDLNLSSEHDWVSGLLFITIKIYNPNIMMIL